MATGRVEVITRAERRRRWSSADKLRLVMATREPGATVAREHGVSESLLYAWRGRLPASGMVGSPLATAAGGFVPITVVGDRPVSTVGPGAGSGPVPPATIEIELPNGGRLRVHERVAASMLRKVIAVLGSVRPRC
jgi:transposase